MTRTERQRERGLGGSEGSRWFRLHDEGSSKVETPLCWLSHCTTTITQIWCSWTHTKNASSVCVTLFPNMQDKNSSSVFVLKLADADRPTTEVALIQMMLYGRYCRLYRSDGSWQQLLWSCYTSERAIVTGSQQHEFACTFQLIWPWYK